MSNDIQKELLKLAQLAGISRDEGIRAAIEMLPVIPNEKVRAERAQRIMSHVSRMAAFAVANGAENHPFLPQPEPEQIPPGDIVIGYLHSYDGSAPVPVSIPFQAMTVHTLFAGPTGRGKSMLTFRVIQQLLARGIPVWIFDTKGEYADILPPLFPRIDVIRFADMKRNPFHGPSGMPCDAWLEHMAGYLREAFFYRDGVINLFRETCARVISDGRDLNAATFAEDFPLRVPNVRRLADYYESLKRMVNTLKLEPYRCATGFDLEALSRRPVVFDLSDISSDHCLFFVADLLTWQDASRTYRRQRGLELVIVMDELSRFYCKEATGRNDLGEPFILQMLRMSRAKGIGMILADQTYARFHDVIRSCCLTKLVLETGDGPSRFQIARDFDLDQEQQSFLGRMSYGSVNRRVLAKLDTYPDPMLLLVPQIEKPVEPTVYRKPDLEWKPLPEKPEAGPRAERDQISHDMEMYLGLIANNWTMSETQHD